MKYWMKFHFGQIGEGFTNKKEIDFIFMTKELTA